MGWLSGSHPAGPLGRGEPQRPPPGQGSPAYLAGSCARCCPSLGRGAALAAARSGCTEANNAVGRGPGPGSGSGASRLHGRAGGRQLGRAPGGRRWQREEEEAEPTGLSPPALPPPPAASNRAGRGGAAAAASFESLDRAAGAEPPSLPLLALPRQGQEDAPAVGCLRGARSFTHFSQHFDKAWCVPGPLPGAGPPGAKPSPWRCT